MFFTKYIDKQAVIKFIDNCLLYEDKLQDAEKATLLTLKSHIMTIPTVDVRPVVKGKWIKINPVDSESDVKCSECESVFEYIDGICYLCVKHRLPPFCPNCGADMRDETIVEVEG